jgi:hypothetical protein
VSEEVVSEEVVPDETVERPAINEIDIREMAIAQLEAVQEQMRKDEEEAKREAEKPVVWRTGRKVFRTIYQNDKLVGLMDTAELATKVVDALNDLEPKPDSADTKSI